MVAETGRKPSPRIRRKRRQARQEILDAALRILREGGDAVTLASVAGRLGMTKQAIYHYFPSKEALIRSLVTTLLDDEIEALISAINAEKDVEKTLGTMIRAFYDHYIDRLDAFRIVYCQSQLYSTTDVQLDAETIRDEINPRTRHLFDVLETRLADHGTKKAQRQRMRRLAFTAWTSALGLLSMLSIAHSTDDPLVHSDTDLLDMLSKVFDGTAADRAHPA